MTAHGYKPNTRQSQKNLGKQATSEDGEVKTDTNQDGEVIPGIGSSVGRGISSLSAPSLGERIVLATVPSVSEKISLGTGTSVGGSNGPGTVFSIGERTIGDAVHSMGGKISINPCSGSSNVEEAISPGSMSSLAESPIGNTVPALGGKTCLSAGSFVAERNSSVPVPSVGERIVRGPVSSMSKKISNGSVPVPSMGRGLSRGSGPFMGVVSPVSEPCTDDVDIRSKIGFQSEFCVVFHGRSFLSLFSIWLLF